MNIHEKLITARAKFIERGIEKSGKNGSLSSTYFTLDDIIPIAIPIFKEVGLIDVTEIFKEVVGDTIVDTAVLTLYNTDRPDEKLTFSFPMRYAESNRGVSPIQSLGASITYARRYLLMLCLDICEVDMIENGLENTGLPAAEKEEKKREKAKKNLTDKEAPADEMQLAALKEVVKQLRAVDPANEALSLEIASETDKFTRASKGKCAELLTKCNEMLALYKGTTA